MSLESVALVALCVLSVMLAYVRVRRRWAKPKAEAASAFEVTYEEVKRTDEALRFLRGDVNEDDEDAAAGGRKRPNTPHYRRAQ